MMCACAVARACMSFRTNISSYFVCWFISLSHCSCGILSLMKLCFNWIYVCNNGRYSTIFLSVACYCVVLFSAHFSRGMIKCMMWPHCCDVNDYVDDDRNYGNESKSEDSKWKSMENFCLYVFSHSKFSPLELLIAQFADDFMGSFRMI